MFLFITLRSLEMSDPLLDREFHIASSCHFYKHLSNETLAVLDQGDWGIEDQTGLNISVSVIDDTCYHTHADLSPRFRLDMSFNFQTNHSDPWIASNFSSGTVYAGIIGAQWNNISIAGIAPNVSMSCLATGTDPEQWRSRMIQALDYHNQNVRIKLIGRRTGLECLSTCEHEPEDDELNSILSRSPASLVYVSSAGADAAKYGNTNFFQVRRNPRVTVVSDINQRGAGSVWNSLGTATLLCAHAGGSSSLFDGKYLFPGLSVLDVRPENNYELVSGDPVGLGAASVAGIAALMLEKNGNLTWRDVQLILAITARRTDFSHPSWVKNAAGYWYSDVYGFGRPSARDAVFMTTLWPLLETQIMDEVVVNETNKIRGMRHQMVEVELNLTSSVEMIEYVTLSLEISDLDYRFLKVLLVSAAGTTAVVKRYSSSVALPTSCEYTIRNFMGESANGVWKLQLVCDHPNCDGVLSGVTLRVFGTKRLFESNQRQGNNPHVQYWEDNTNVSIESEIIECGEPVNVTITSELDDSPLTLLLGDEGRTSRWPLLKTVVNPSHVKTVTIPCHYHTNSRLKLIVDATNSETDVRTGESNVFTVKNTKTPWVIEDPSPYQVMRMTDNGINIPISVVMDFSVYPDGAPLQNVHVTLYDMDNKTVVGEHVCSPDNISITYTANETCEHCLISVTPVWTPLDTMTCVEMIQPIAIIREDDTDPGIWTVPLDLTCPTPPGIRTGDPTPEPKKRNELPGLLVGVFFFISFGLFVALYFFCNRKTVQRESTSKSLLGFDD